MSSDLPSSGEIFEERYRIERVLGAGGFAEVFVARDLELGRQVALKVLRPQRDGYDDRNATRFMREAKHVARLNHPNVVTMFDYGKTDDGLLYAVFELVGGHDLTQLMSDGPMPIDTVVKILAQVLDALSAAHDAGLLHRDVKPDNIRVFEYMGDPHCVKLLDFGIARPTRDDAGLTESGMVVGTPRFMAPEQLYEEPSGPHSDIYSVGLVAYEMIVAERADHLQRLIHKQRVELPPDAAVDPSVRRVVDRMLERHVPPRYASALAALNDLLSASEAARSKPPVREKAPAEADSVPRSPAPRSSIEVEPVQRSSNASLLFAGAIAVVLTLTAAGLLVGLGRAAEDRSAPDESTTTIGSSAAAEPVDPVAELKVVPIERDGGSGSNAADTRSPGIRRDGCGIAAEFVGTRSVVHTDALDALEWIAHVPSGYDPDVAHPLVVLLHDDSGSSPAFVMKSTSLASTADEHQFLIAAPRDDDIAYPWTEPQDLENVENVVQLMQQSYCVDSARIFVIGYGGGGWGAERLSCRDWVAGLALTSFLLETPEFRCEPARAVPTLTILPMKSQFMPAEGGPDCIGNSKLSFARFEKMWRQRNRCSDDRVPFARHAGGRCQKWSCDQPYVSCRVDGGRRWTGAPVRNIDVLGCDGPGNTFPNNDAIWQFFSSIE